MINVSLGIHFRPKIEKNGIITNNLIHTICNLESIYLWMELQNKINKLFLPISHENLSHGQLTRALLSTNQIPCVFVLRQSDHERPNRKDVL